MPIRPAIMPVPVPISVTVLVPVSVFVPVVTSYARLRAYVLILGSMGTRVSLIAISSKKLRL